MKCDIKTCKKKLFEWERKEKFVRMRLQTVDKNITIIHKYNTTPVHQLSACEVKNSMFVRNISIM